MWRSGNSAAWSGAFGARHAVPWPGEAGTRARAGAPKHRRPEGPASVALALALGMFVGCSPSQPPDAPREGGRRPDSEVRAIPACFTDVTEATGLDFVHRLVDGQLSHIMESDGAGGTFLDYDGDGFLDVYLVQSGVSPVFTAAAPGTPRPTNRLYRNRGDGTFEDATERAGVGGRGFGATAASADYDNDGDADLLVVNLDGLILYRNEGDGRFVDVTVGAGLSAEGPGISATFLDVDQDGFLDVFVANYLHYDPAIVPAPGSRVPFPGPMAYPAEFNVLYRNRGDGTFEDISEPAGVRIAGHRAMSVTAFDYDVDGDPDLYVSNDGTANLLLANDGRGHFTDVGLRAGVGFNRFGAAEGSMGAAVGDYDGDGLGDLFVTRFGSASLYANSPGGFFDDRIEASGLLAATSRYTGWGGNLFDHDNDGDLDLFVANGDAHVLRGMPPLLFENRGDGTFVEASACAGPLGALRTNARGSGAWDFDNDGRMDLLITALAERATVWRNTRPETGHWLTLKLEGTRGNRDALGAQVRLTVGGRTRFAEARCPTSYEFQEDSRLHFGLGTNASVERLEIRWPGGQRQILTQVAGDRVLPVIEPGISRWTGR